MTPRNDTPRHPGQPLLNPEFVHEGLGFPPLGGRAVHDPHVPFTSVTTDSRAATAGCLFVAVKGEKFDGHDFIPAVLEKGARGIICKRGTQIPAQKNLHIYAVEDTVQAYRKLGAAWRREFSIPVAVIAGSVGKTTTKEILAAVLRGKYPQVLRTQGSQNGFLGIPMTLLELRPEHGAAVIEVGIDEIGTMQGHMSLVNGTTSLLTAIAPEHLEKLIDLPSVAREEGIALSAVAQSGGTVAINLDDPWIRPHFATLKGTGHKIGYTMTGVTPSSGTSSDEHLQGTLSADAKSLSVSGLRGKEMAKFELPLPGRHNAGNLLAAVALAHGMGLTPEQMAIGLATFKGAEGRSELRTLTGPTPVVCDYYNASPASMEAGIDLLTQVHGGRKDRARWACLGEMLELGTEEEQYHRKLAEPILRSGIENVLLYGPRMQALYNELTAKGFSGGMLSHHSSHESIANEVVSKARPGDAILIKGSRSMKMEEVWKRIEKSWPKTPTR